MESTLNLNLNPYYDDFDETKGFVRILFKPGYGVQARELIQLQTQLQNQITKFGNHIFKEGSVISGGNFKTSNISYILVSRANDIENFDGQIITGNTSGARGRVISTSAVSEDVAKVYFQYLSGKRFTQNEVITCTNLNVETIVDLTNFYGSAINFTIDDSIFYILGNFVFCETQSIIIAEDSKPTCVVGLDVTESIVTYNSDTSLLDPALGSSNYSAPGADRYHIGLSLAFYPYNPEEEYTEDNVQENFIELTRFINGIIQKLHIDTSYAELEKTLARRTYDESGDYTVNAFKIRVLDSIYNNEDELSIRIEPGKAYVKGYEFYTDAVTYLTLPKARTYNSENEFPIYINYGKYIYIENPRSGVIDYTRNPTLNLKNSGASVIGNCQVRYIEYDSQNGANSVYKLYADTFTFTTGSIKDVVSVASGAFVANISVDSYSSNVAILGNDNPTNIIQIPKENVKEVISSETSYETLVKLPSNASFTSNGSYSTAVAENTAPANQVFLGSGILSESDTRSLYYAVVATSANTAAAPIGKVLDYDTDMFRIAVVNETTLALSTNIKATFTATVFGKVAISGATQKTKVLQDGTLTLTGGSLTRSYLSRKITTGKADCIRLQSVKVYTATSEFDYTNNYRLDSGQTNTLYDHGFIQLKPGYTDPISDGIASITSIVIKFRYYSHSGTNSGFFNVNSYPDYNDIPKYKSPQGVVYDLKNCFDFRARRDDDATTITGGLLGEPSSLIISDFDYYQGRIDRLVITSDKSFDLVEGIPSDTPEIPTDVNDAMPIYTIEIDPYTQTRKNVTTTYIENKRYTMRDIGKLEKRIERVEYYAALSMLEKQSSDESIPSDIVGIDRFKNGILVDSFAGHSVGDINNPGYACSIDYENKTLRPSFSSAHYRFQVASGVNYKRHNSLLTLAGSVEYLINQSLVSTSINVTPYNVFKWNGYVTLKPESDTWVSTTTLPDVTVNINGENDAFTRIVDEVENPASVGIKWSDWSTLVKGITDVSTSSGSSTAVSYSGSTKTSTTTTTTNTTSTISEALTSVGVQIATSDVQTITRSLGTKVVNTSLVPFIRSRAVKFFAHSLKPETSVHALFDDVNVSSYCSIATILTLADTINDDADSVVYSSNTALYGDVIEVMDKRVFVDENGGLFNIGDTVNILIDKTSIMQTTITGIERETSLVTNERGEIGGIFQIPNNNRIRFRTGEREFTITDRPNSDVSTTAATTNYIAQGLAQTIEETLLSTRVANVSITPTVKNANVTRTQVETEVTTKKVTEILAPCAHTENGGKRGKFEYDLNFGANTGTCGITFGTGSRPVPDRFTIIWDGKKITSGFVGSADYNKTLSKLGYPHVTTEDNQGQLLFDKNKVEPAHAKLIVDAPIPGTGWKFKVVCPGKTPVAPTKKTSVSGSFVIDAPETIVFNRREATLKGVVKLTVHTTGTTSQYIRISGLSANVTGQSAGTVTFANNTVDLETVPDPKIADRRVGTAKVNVTFSRPVKDDTSYSVLITGIADVYSNASRTVHDTLLPDPLSGRDRSVVSRDDIIAHLRVDPVAQTFMVDSEIHPSGVFLHSAGLFFRTKDSTLPVMLELRKVVNGYPSSDAIIPMSQVSLPPSKVTTSTTGTVETRFYFRNPIYLKPGQYAIVVKSNSVNYEIYTARLGDFLLNNSNKRITAQPSIGSLFTSQNASTWTPVQEMDMSFRLYKYYYNTGAANTATVTLECINILLGDRYYDMLFADGESLNFRDTSIKYAYKTTDLATLTKDSTWKSYQIGSNTPMNNRKIVRKQTEDDLEFQVTLRTDNRDVTPVIDLQRFSTVVVKNEIDNRGLSTPDFVITYQGLGYTGNAAVNITADTGSGAAAYAAYRNGKLGVIVTNPGSGYTGNVSATIALDGTATENAVVQVKNEIYTNLESLEDVGNNDARYITRKVTLAPGFESTDIMLYFNAKLPSGTGVIPYYKVAPVGTVDFNKEPWRKFVLRSSDTPDSSKFVEYSYKTSGDTALPSGDKFQTFAIKLVLYSTNTTRVPEIKDLRAIALDE